VENKIEKTINIKKAPFSEGAFFIEMFFVFI